MHEVLTTDQRRKAAKRLLKILTRKKLSKPNAVNKLTKPIKVKTASGQKVEKAPIYDSTGDAKDLVKKLVDDDKSPIDSKDEKIFRTDTLYEGEKL